MKKSLSLLVLLGIAIAACSVAGAQQKTIYPDRWLYLNTPLKSDQDVEVMRDLIVTAANHGLNGIVLPNMDRLSLASPEQPGAPSQGERDCRCEPHGDHS